MSKRFSRKTPQAGQRSQQFHEKALSSKYPKIDSRSRDECDGSFTGLLRFQITGVFFNVTIEQGLETLEAWR